MLYRKMGKRGTEVSALGLGCMRLPVIDGDEGRIDEVRAEAVIRRAIECGVTYVDTAWPYHRGSSEPFVGKVLASAGLRDAVQLATKLPVWEVRSREDCDRFLKEQMERLQTDHIDFYLLHALNRERWEALLPLGVLDFLDEALADGRIGHAGFSFHDEAPVFREILDSYDWDFCLLQHNYMDVAAQQGLEGLERAAGRGIGVAVMEPLRGGQLVTKVPAAVKELFEASGRGWCPAEWALRWVWNHGGVSVVLSGMGSVDEVERNGAIADRAPAENLTAQDLALIDRVRTRYRERIAVNCTGCGYCMPCPEGVDIPAVLALYNDLSIYEAPEVSFRQYGRVMNPRKWASNCVGCGLCEAACPQKLAVIDELGKAHQALGAPERS